MSLSDRNTNLHEWYDYDGRAREMMLVLSELQSEHPGVFVNSATVLWKFFERTNCVTKQLELCLDDDSMPLDRDALSVYYIIVGLSHDESDYRMIYGQGNFGTPTRGMPPAHPRFTEICLTERARRMIGDVESL